jgi:hypothetical protein
MKTNHGEEFIRKEIYDEIDMRYPINLTDIDEIADQYGVDAEDVKNILQSYKIDKAKEKNERLTNHIKDVLHDMNLSVDKPLPTFEDFYKKFKPLYNHDGEFDEKEVKNKFKEMTTDPKQLKLFEIRNNVRKLMSEMYYISPNQLLSQITEEKSEKAEKNLFDFIKEVEDLGNDRGCFKTDTLDSSKLKKAFAVLALEMNNFWHDNLKDEFKK